MSLPILVIGGGGHARVLIDGMLLQGRTIIGYTEMDTGAKREAILGVPFVGGDDCIHRYSPHELLLVNGIGSIGSPERRRKIFESFKSKGYSFYSFVHPSAILAPTAQLGEGVQIMAGAIVQTGSSIGDNTILNTKASVDHDCNIGNHVHLAPGTTLSGSVHVEDGVHIGTGATVIQQIHIYKNSIIGAGSVVVKDVMAGRTVYGVPAKEVKV
ncbi:acetyltransferase [Paenibacillus piri]|uniref:Acetyltransferase n=1 Tax=Paenibacillus piri TaxID=2547395 RepID=A0A4R5KGW7_9BACL|nr:acetyltransferase [Paenibacillus piri]TDF93490.1 acetyltransferase [Paenibacillus piri]